MLISRQRRLYLYFPVIMYLFFSGHNENFPPQQKNCQFPANRRLYLFFLPVVIKISRHYKKNTFPVVIKISRLNKKTANIPPEPKTDTIQQHNLPDRRLYLFFPVVIKISRHYKKNANFRPEPKTDTTAQPTRQTTVSFFFRS